ncbi:MAG: tetratricopeptide repeat protein [Prevotellaceae bacterium]|nr:tetratricopeptide repeat protein [Prevotellaceae bacterium]
MKQLLLIILLAVSAVASAQTDRKFVREGNRLFHKEDYAKAEIQYRKAISKNPSNSQAVYNLGCALMMQNKDSAAVEQYQKAAKMETNKMRRAMIWHNVGVICQNSKIYDEAIKAYSESLRNNPKDDETRYNLALCKKLQKIQGNNFNNNNQNNQNMNKDDKGKDIKVEKNKDDNDKNDKNKDKKQQQQQQPKEQISKDNIEQMLNAAMQNEQQTQERLKKATQQQGTRRLQKNW